MCAVDLLCLRYLGCLPFWANEIAKFKSNYTETVEHQVSSIFFQMNGNHKFKHLEFVCKSKERISLIKVSDPRVEFRWELSRLRLFMSKFIDQDEVLVNKYARYSRQVHSLTI